MIVPLRQGSSTVGGETSPVGSETSAAGGFPELTATGSPVGVSRALGTGVSAIRAPAIRRKDIPIRLASGLLRRASRFVSKWRSFVISHLQLPKKK
jgi:hypothetical protein